VGLYHCEGEDDLNLTGVPSLVFDDEHALQVVLAEEIPDATAAARLLDALCDLLVQPVVEVRRTA
jgi:hypothetical protein